MSFLNRTINNLPFELHLPGYNYCGPGTKLETRLSRGDKGKNPLDEACKEHDIAYSKSHNLADRHMADRTLGDKAWGRVKARNSSLGERLAALGVAGAMKAKVKLGLGLKSKLKKKIKKRCSFRSIVKKVSDAVKLASPPTVQDAIKIAVKKAKQLKKHIEPPRVIPINHKGGALPILAVLAGLSAIGGLASGSASIANAVNKAKEASRQLQEMKRHNGAMEAIAIGKGLYLAPYKKGSGLYFTPGAVRKN